MKARANMFFLGPLLEMPTSHISRFLGEIRRADKVSISNTPVQFSQELVDSLQASSEVRTVLFSYALRVTARSGNFTFNAPEHRG